MFRFVLKAGAIGGGAYLGQWAVNKFVFEKGLVTQSEGIGLDDLVLALGMGVGGVLGSMLASKL
jgi:hypothetical protein